MRGWEADGPLFRKLLNQNQDIPAEASRIAFGKHKGRLFREARKDAELRRWLDWLASSSNPRTARMGRWYLGKLESEPEAQADKDYEETATAVAQKKQLTAEEEAELTRLWKKLVKLYHPDRFANQPDKLETYVKLTSAINRAKDSGDIATLREIAEDPHGFILRQGWASLDFSEESELMQLRRLHETLQLEIIAVLESLNRLKESPDYELCRLSENKPGLLDDLAVERARLLDQETTELEEEANRLAEEITELSGQPPGRIT